MAPDEYLASLIPRIQILTELCNILTLYCPEEWSGFRIYYQAHIGSSRNSLIIAKTYLGR